MGILEDAIKEHLELKRKHGASSEEVKELEKQALGSGGGPGLPLIAVPATSQEPQEEAAHEKVTHDEAAYQEPMPEELAQKEPMPDKPEPEEAAPEEPEPEEAAQHEPKPDEPEQEKPGTEEAAQAAVPPEDDILEETPEFLDKTPDQDQLWFEQKPPKDFDF